MLVGNCTNCGYRLSLDTSRASCACCDRCSELHEAATAYCAECGRQHTGLAPLGGELPELCPACSRPRAASALPPVTSVASGNPGLVVAAAIVALAVLGVGVYTKHQADNTVVIEGKRFNLITCAGCKGSGKLSTAPIFDGLNVPDCPACNGKGKVPDLAFMFEERR